MAIYLTPEMVELCELIECTQDPEERLGLILELGEAASETFDASKLDVSEDVARMAAEHQALTFRADQTAIALGRHVARARQLDSERTTTEPAPIHLNSPGTSGAPS